MMRLESDLVPALMASARGDLSGIDLTWSQDPALTVVMAAQGYPGSYEKGTRILLDAVARAMNWSCFTRAHAPKRRQAHGARGPRAKRHRARQNSGTGSS